MCLPPPTPPRPGAGSLGAREQAGVMPVQGRAGARALQAVCLRLRPGCTPGGPQGDSYHIPGPASEEAAPRTPGSRAVSRLMPGTKSSASGAWSEATSVSARSGLRWASALWRSKPRALGRGPQLRPSRCGLTALPSQSPGPFCHRLSSPFCQMQYKPCPRQVMSLSPLPGQLSPDPHPASLAAPGVTVAR